jgi:peroxiredoxin-like protein
VTTTGATTGRVRTKEFSFPLTVDWVGGRKVLAHVEGKPSIPIATPPEFRGTDPDVWSPEDFFVGAAASCLAVTFAGLAERKGLAVESLRVSGDGVAGMRQDGAFGFVRLELRLELEAAAADHELARELAETAEATCLVSVSLDVPVETTIDVREPVAA